MENGYQLVEPAILAKLLPAAPNEGMGLAALSWIVERVRAKLGGALAHVDVDVIPVNYLGVYPAIGVRYHGEHEDLAPTIERAVAELLSGTPVIEFSRVHVAL